MSSEPVRRRQLPDLPRGHGNRDLRQAAAALAADRSSPLVPLGSGSAA